MNEKSNSSSFRLFSLSKREIWDRMKKKVGFIRNTSAETQAFVRAQLEKKGEWKSEMKEQ